MAPNLPLPPQISTDPAVNASAMAWAGQLVDALQKIISGSTPSGVDADKLDSRDSTDFASAVGSATSVKAKDADLLDGLDSTAFLGVSAKAADSDKLDGIDSLGFLQLAVAGAHKIAFGAASLTWAAAAFNSNILTVNHGLGVAPIVVVAIAQGGGTPAHFFCNARNFTTTGFDLQGNVAQPDAAPGASSQNALWVAIS